MMVLLKGEKMKKTIFLVCLVLAIVVAFVGCGKNESIQDNESGSITEQTDLSSEEKDNSANNNNTEESDFSENQDINESEPIDESNSDSDSIDFERVTEWYRNNSMLLCDGVYFVGSDMVPASYGIKCSSFSDGINVIVFDNEEAYYTYHHSSRFTNGEESDAIEANASQYDYLRADKEIALNLHEGNVLMIKNGIGELSYSDSDKVVESETIVGEKRNLFDGNYVVGKDIDSGGYMITSTGEYGTRFIVFASEQKLADFEAEDHFTNGEFGADVEKNAIIDLFVYKEKQCYINLKDGMVLMLNNGTGIAQKVTMVWAE